MTTHTTKAPRINPHQRPNELFISKGIWICQCHDMSTQERGIFGTDLIPTPFLAQMPSYEVIARLQALNPQIRYIVRGGAA